jgi:biopolymer transport protein ExbD/biopolymer transport protein TolR
MAIGGKTGDIFTEINVTPLTDVFLVLLVIMILVAPLVNQTVLKVDPPAASANPNQKPPDEKNKIDVEVYGNGMIKINGAVVPPSRPEDLSMNIQQMIAAEQQKAGNPDIPLNLASEPDSVEKNVVAVMDAAAGAGIKQMRVLPLRQLGGK